MEPEIRQRKLRIVSGTVAEVEDQLNRLLNDYNAIVWSFFDCAGVPTAAVVLLHSSVSLQAAIAQRGPLVRN